MRIYTINRNSVILTACVLLLMLSITFWLNAHVSQSNNLQLDYDHLSVPEDDDSDEEDETLSEIPSESASVVASEIQIENDYDDYQKDEDDDDDNENPVFRKGDFDEQYTFNNSMQITSSDKVNLMQQTESASSFNFKEVSEISDRWPIVEDGIFWSDYLERQMPKGINKEGVQQLQMTMRATAVQQLLPPSWNQCGRPKNQIVIFADGSRACARYRVPHHYLVEGEVLSFYLARLLNISNVPVLVLSQVNPVSHQWSHSLEITKAIRLAGWKINSTVALIRWISDLKRSQMPEMILEALTKGVSISSKYKQLRSISISNAAELMQWSDLILFDYLTGNYDRIASMQDTADKDKAVFNETVHNLVRSSETGAMWLIDNESGLLDAYSLLYSEDNPIQGKRFRYFHMQMLQTLCVFRRYTVKQLEILDSQSDPHQFLLNLVREHEPLFDEGAIEPTRYELFSNHFKQRVSEIRKWIDHCRSAYA